MKIRMTVQRQNPASAEDFRMLPIRAGLCLLILFAAIVMTASLAQAQTFQVLHAFSGEGDDAAPLGGLTAAAPGKFYGSTSGKIIGNNGSVFELTSRGSGWLLNPLINFGNSGNGPSDPYSKLTIGPDGALYGTTFGGGTEGFGTVFKLQPPPNACGSFSCPWTLTVVHNFDWNDGAEPIGEVVFDHAGNIYGTTSEGGGNCTVLSGGCGVVYELSPSGSGWTETVIFNFSSEGGNAGAFPSGGLIFDAAGNLYGVTWFGGSPSNSGVIYKLSPPQGEGWTETVLYQAGLGGLGFSPVGTLLMDGSGNLYGEMQGGGLNNGGTVFQLTRQEGYQDIYSFPANSDPQGSLVSDSSGNLYGTSSQGGINGYGSAIKLVPSNGSWIETDLHVFQASDGIYPGGSLVLDSANNLYGVAQAGGHFSGVCSGGCGTVWEISP
jgi:uncharacterized repeat protein (TIGR03803 family)